MGLSNLLQLIIHNNQQTLGLASTVNMSRSQHSQVTQSMCEPLSDNALLACLPAGHALC